jgi:copper homeostasis protein CutC
VVRHLESLRVLRLYAAKYGVVIMPGSGVTAGNVVEVVRATGCREVHGSFDGGNSVRDVRSNLQG